MKLLLRDLKYQNAIEISVNISFHASKVFQYSNEQNAEADLILKTTSKWWKETNARTTLSPSLSLTLSLSLFTQWTVIIDGNRNFNYDRNWTENRTMSLIIIFMLFDGHWRRRELGAWTQTEKRFWNMCVFNLVKWNANLCYWHLSIPLQWDTRTIDFWIRLNLFVAFIAFHFSALT